MSVTLNNIEDSILPLVSKPNRYLGNFEGARVKDHAATRVKIALAFPDCFDLGMSHLGIKILYRLINEREDALAELAFAPWPDMEELMRAHGLPLFTLETRTPLRDFDVIGFSLQYELHYTTVLNMLDLAGLPVYSKDRGEGAPLVIAGGPCAYAPEPVAPFIDAILVGDGEEAVGKVLDAVVAAKHDGAGRSELLRRLASIEGVYVPSLYEMVPNSQGFVTPSPVDGAPGRITAARIRSIESAATEPAHLVPLTDIAHSRLSVEVMRGCPRSCRFCMPGVIYHPVRRKKPEDVLRELQRGMERGGWEEVSLLSLSTSDYKGVSELVQDVSKLFLGRGVNISLPSIRPGTLPPQLARTLTFVRKSGLTFAPEAGSDRMRRVIDKGVTEEEMVHSIKVAAAAGWNAVKLYFMVGLPTETEEDVRAIGRLVFRLRDVAKSAAKAAAKPGGVSRGRKMGLKVSVAGFVPKPHTPFQWEGQLDAAEMASRIGLLSKMLKSKGLRLRWRDVETSYLEGLLSRGDRRLADVIHAAWKRGCRFDGWSDLFKFDEWRGAIEESGIDEAAYLGPRRPGDRLPWSHIGPEGSEKSLLRERERANAEAGEEAPPDAGTVSSPGSGKEGAARQAADASGRGETTEECPPSLGGEAISNASNSLYGRRRKKTRGSQGLTGTNFRLQYAKLDSLRFISHLDVVRAFDRALRKAGLPIAFSQGFAKHPKMAFGPPLPVGVSSVAEYLDLEFSAPVAETFANVLGESLPDGLSVVEVKPHGGSKPPSLMGAISRADYRIWLSPYLAGVVAQEKGPGAVEAAFDAAPGLIEETDGNDGPSWREAVAACRVEHGNAGPGLAVTVRLDMKKGPKIWEIGAGLLDGLDLDPRLVRFERTAMWVVRGAGAVDPFEALDERPWDTAAGMEGYRV
jgi:radical SAM family uncharacterized protein/radical SAM-linked protein